MITAAATSTNETTTIPASSRARSDTYRSRSAYPNPRMVWISRGSTVSTFLRR